MKKHNNDIYRFAQAFFTLSGHDKPNEKKIFFSNCDSLHATLNRHYDAWSYKKKKHKKITAYKKSA